LKIRTSSLPLFGSTGGTNEPVPMISPPITLPTEISFPSQPLIEPPITINSSRTDNEQMNVDQLSSRVKRIENFFNKIFVLK
jgi:hypothetical protein